MEDKGDNSGGFLGELPQELRRERGELYDKEPRPQGPPGIINEIPGTRAPEIPPPPALPSARDVGRGQRALDSAENAMIGLPPVAFLVQSTFDARPINGNDWQRFGFFTLDIGGDPPGNSNPVDLIFTVPRGRVGIIRRFEWEPDTYLALSGPGQPATQEEMDDGTRNFASPFFVRLIVAGSIQTSYESIYQQAGQRECYAIAAERDQIILRFQFNSNFIGSVTSYFPNITAKMYGNLLDTQGREKQYEPANQYRGGSLR